MQKPLVMISGLGVAICWITFIVLTFSGNFDSGWLVATFWAFLCLISQENK